MSYAAVTAKNAHQSPEEARANPVPELEHHSEATSTTSLIDVDSPHISSVPSDYESQEVKTTTQADRLEREEHDAEAAAKAKAHKAKVEAEAKAKSAKKKIVGGGQKLRENADNPVVIANGILGVLLAGSLGYGAYVKYRAGEFSWKVVGVGAAVLGAFSVVDYYASQYLFKKYPPKK